MRFLRLSALSLSLFLFGAGRLIIAARRIATKTINVVSAELRSEGVRLWVNSLGNEIRKTVFLPTRDHCDPITVSSAAAPFRVQFWFFRFLSFLNFRPPSRDLLPSHGLPSRSREIKLVFKSIVTAVFRQNRETDAGIKCFAKIPVRSQCSKIVSFVYIVLEGN